MKRRALFGFPALLLGFMLHAATLEQLSMDDMMRKSTAIVRARVTGSYAAASRRTIYTHYRLQVIEQLKGAATSTADVVLPGGTLGGVRQMFPGTPALVTGNEYVLFLWTGPSGLTHIMGLTQGVFDVKQALDGDAVAYRPAISESMLDASGRPVRTGEISLRLSDLRRQIRTSASSGRTTR